MPIDDIVILKAIKGTLPAIAGIEDTARPRLSRPLPPFKPIVADDGATLSGSKSSESFSHPQMYSSRMSLSLPPPKCARGIAAVPLDESVVFKHIIVAARDAKREPSPVQVPLNRNPRV